MQVGIEDLIFLEHGTLDRLRFFDLDDHVDALEELCRAGHQGSTGCGVILIARTDAFAGRVLYQYFVTVCYQLAGTLRCQPDSIFVVLDFLGGTDAHELDLLMLGKWALPQHALCAAAVGLHLQTCLPSHQFCACPTGIRHQ